MQSISVPSCSRCNLPSIIHQPYSGQSLCGRCLKKSVRRKVGKELRSQFGDSLSSEKTLLVAISGGKDSAVLLELMCHFLKKRRDLKIVAGCVDEGIEGYRKPSLEMARELANELGVQFETVSYPELGFKEMDKVAEMIPVIGQKNSEAKGMAPCAFCGVFRRQGLNHLAKRVGADFIATGHNLDDMAQTVLMNMQKGDIDRTVRLAPHSWAPLKGLAPRIVPLRWIPEQEIQAYAMTCGLKIHHDECPHATHALRQLHRDVIATMEEAVPGSRHGLVHSADGVKELYIKTQGESELDHLKNTNSCNVCGEITSQLTCKACLMKSWILDQEEE